MAQNIIYSPWERTKSLWLCLKTTLLLFGLLWPFSFVSAFLISLIKLIHRLKFPTDRRQAEDTGGWDGGGQKGPQGPATFRLLHFSWLYMYLPGVLSYFHPFYHLLILKCIFSTQMCSSSSRHMYPVGCGSLLLWVPWASHLAQGWIHQVNGMLPLDSKFTPTPWFFLGEWVPSCRSDKI